MSAMDETHELTLFTRRVEEFKFHEDTTDRIVELLLLFYRQQRRIRITYMDSDGRQEPEMPTCTGVLTATRRKLLCLKSRSNCTTGVVVWGQRIGLIHDTATAARLYTHRKFIPLVDWRFPERRKEAEGVWRIVVPALNPLPGDADEYLFSASSGYGARTIISQNQRFFYLPKHCIEEQDKPKRIDKQKRI